MDHLDPVDCTLDTLNVMSWQRRVIRNILEADTPDEMFCFTPPREQIRLDLSYEALMEHYSVEVIRRDRS